MSTTEMPMTPRKSRFANHKPLLGLAGAGLFAIVLCVLAVFSVERMHRRAEQLTSENNLKQLAHALHKYNDARQRLPDHAIVDQETGKPLLSWRVALLPFLGEKELYDQIRLDESWDSDHNRQFWDKIPAVYQLRGKPTDGTTYYQVFQGDGALFANVEKYQAGTPTEFWRGTKYYLQNIPNGPQNTIFAVEAAKLVNWMKPEDILFVKGSDGTSLELLGNHWGDGIFRLVLCDGSIRAVNLNQVAPKTLQAAIDPEGLLPREMKACVWR
jgi:hypothetical protein